MLPALKGAYLFPFYPNKSAGSTCNYEQYDRLEFEKRVFRNSGKRRINRDAMISRGSKRTNSRFDEKPDETRGGREEGREGVHFDSFLAAR